MLLSNRPPTPEFCRPADSRDERPAHGAILRLPDTEVVLNGEIQNL